MSDQLQPDAGFGDRLVTIRQAIVQRPFFSERFLRRLSQDGRVPSYRVGRYVLFDLADLDEFIVSTRREATPRPGRMVQVVREDTA